jgi:hypothetical protein
VAPGCNERGECIHVALSDTHLVVNSDIWSIDKGIDRGETEGTPAPIRIGESRDAE